MRHREQGSPIPFDSLPCLPFHPRVDRTEALALRRFDVIGIALNHLDT
jgi:hypothetical protein